MAIIIEKEEGEIEPKAPYDEILQRQINPSNAPQ
jgi:hypothetical protein